MLADFAAFVLRQGRWRLLRPRVASPCGAICAAAWCLYVKDAELDQHVFRSLPHLDDASDFELTGVYTLFWSIANVVHSLAVYGVLQAQLPH